MFEQIRANQRRTIVLVVAMACLLLLLGYVLGEAMAPGAGTFGLLMAFVVWIILSLVSYFSGDQIFLTLSSARKIQKEDHPVLFNVVEEMCIASGVARVPDIYVIDDAAPNAFATGRDPQHASVAVPPACCSCSAAMSCRVSLRTNWGTSGTGTSSTS